MRAGVGVGIGAAVGCPGRVVGAGAGVALGRTEGPTVGTDAIRFANGGRANGGTTTAGGVPELLARTVKLRPTGTSRSLSRTWIVYVPGSSPGNENEPSLAAVTLAESWPFDE